MLKDITNSQRALCSKCQWRVKEHDNIVFCPFVYNCRKKQNLNHIYVEKGGNINVGSTDEQDFSRKP